MTRPDEFDAFYTATARRVVHHVYALCGDLAEAQDAVQEAYARAWQRWSTVGSYEDPEGWVRTVAWRLTANRWRSLRRWWAARSRLGRETPVPGPNPDRVALLAALRRLPEAQRRVVVLYHLQDLPVAEIARVTGMPVGTVKAYLSRARAALAILLDDDEKEESHVAHS
ncbi:SigE family RNA polymerase sigma factor [Micromonospora narathiwatensis]|uniref:RNA polymerase sigma-70 factor, ECF subfamily n=1 Tax=Micromonospora narathiwatensis TaxID=299146 RepID=A0A1A9A6G3_9ACTN|nr:SigE family RNA polymerase sigma factor [Micromonospora narathiwatensis]SBT51690.1 RNA polymerase sigma-70 factor, ECF subfamily [Micromonospora narathiwatensis]